MNTVEELELSEEGLARKFQKELNAGLTGLVLLTVLDKANEDLYGYQIAKQLQVVSPTFGLKQGVLYPVLRAMSANGLLSSRVVPSYAGPPRRYYRITDLGRTALGHWQAIWRETRAFVDVFVEPSQEQQQ
jgi:PadR family transcriptional regulator PadR